MNHTEAPGLGPRPDVADLLTGGNLPRSVLISARRRRDRRRIYTEITQKGTRTCRKFMQVLDYLVANQGLEPRTKGL